MVGMEGLYGMIMTSFVILGASYVPCPFRQISCTCTDDGVFVESPNTFFQEISNNSLITVFAVMMSLSVGVSNIIGVNVTKYINALGRSILDAARGVLVWGIGLVLTSYDVFNRRYESFEWYVVLCKLAGLAALIFATLVYNELIFVRKLSDRS